MKNIIHPAKKLLNFGLEVKLMFAFFSRFVGFRQYGDEYQQAVFRLLMMSTVTTFIFCYYEEVSPVTTIIMAWFSLFSIALLILSLIHI